MTFKWRFNKMRPSDKAREPIQGEFFTTESINKPGEALVREGIQNSLDARYGNEKVLVRIKIRGEESAIKRKDVNAFFEGLAEHLSAPGNGLQDIPKEKDNCPFLVFEDFGTTGLLGDVKEWKPKDGEKNNFYHFFRAEGRSDKGDQDRGRWGVGKQVFLAASRINTIFGLTVRRDDKQKFLMGMSVLKSHDIGRTRFAPDGWLGKQDGSENDDLILPIDDQSYIDQFCKTFDIHRGDSPGLTLMIPWVNTDLSDEKLIRAVIRGYFWPILKQQLEVIIEASKIETLLNRTSLMGELEKIGGDLIDEIQGLYELGDWACHLIDSDYITLRNPREWKWDVDMFPSEKLRQIQTDLDQGKKIAIRIPIIVVIKDKAPEKSHFDVFLHRDGLDKSRKPVYIREGIIIPDVRQRSSSTLNGIRSLVVAEDTVIAKLLGDAENPAHTEWQEKGANFKNKYEDGGKIIDFVRRSPIEIVKILNSSGDERDYTILADFFPIPLPQCKEDESITESEKIKRKKIEPEQIIAPLSQPQPVLIDRINGGFVIRENADSNNGLPKQLSIRAAYHIRRGNPFDRYHPADFNFSQEDQIQIEINGAEILNRLGNQLEVKICNKSFRIKVTGFDLKRDVRLEVNPLEDGRANSNI